MTYKRSAYKRQSINPFKSNIPRPKPAEMKREVKTPEVVKNSDIQKQENASTVYEDLSSFNPAESYT